MFKPMLAHNVNIKDLRLPVCVSNKLEGVRAEFTPGGLKSRPMKDFNNKWLAQHFKPILDYCVRRKMFIEGEFYTHRMTFNEISSICRRGNHPDTGKLELHVFDMFVPEYPAIAFTERFKAINTIVKHLNIPHIKVVPQRMINDHEMIEYLYSEALTGGYEGLVFKNPNALYKGGRPTKQGQQFLRIKPDITFDGVVLEIVERFENLVESVENEMGYLSKRQDKDMKAATGMAAVAIVRCPDFPEPVRVVLSKNLTDSDRYDIWEDRESLVGKHLKFYGIPVPGMNQPRCPRFGSWRTDLD